jgi:maltose/maltodextrin transport system substrate-binding protein
LAVEFIEGYLLQEEGLEAVDNDRALGAVTHKAFMKTLADKNPTLGDAFKVWQTSEAMPNIPAMGAFWSNMGPAITAITQGRQSVEDSLNDAAERIIR